jgi:hypothetical protein
MINTLRSMCARAAAVLPARCRAIHARARARTRHSAVCSGHFPQVRACAHGGGAVPRRAECACAEVGGACVRESGRARARTHAHTCARAHTPIRARTHTRPCAHTPMRARARTHAHARARAAERITSLPGRQTQRKRVQARRIRSRSSARPPARPPGACGPTLPITCAGCLSGTTSCDGRASTAAGTSPRSRSRRCSRRTSGTSCGCSAAATGHPLSYDRSLSVAAGRPAAASSRRTEPHGQPAPPTQWATGTAVDTYARLRVHSRPACGRAAQCQWAARLSWHLRLRSPVSRCRGAAARAGHGRDHDRGRGCPHGITVTLALR